MSGAENEDADTGVRTEAGEAAGEAPNLMLAGGEFGREVKGDERFAPGGGNGPGRDTDGLAKIACADTRDRDQVGGLGGEGRENFAAETGGAWHRRKGFH